MLNRKLSAGDIIDARCTRCRDILNHRIVAMVGEKVVRVECNTCGGVHNYYPPPTVKGPKQAKSSESSRVSAPRASKKDPLESEREEWVSLRASMQVDTALKYDMEGSYKVNSVLNHSVFGIGIVKSVVSPNKMQVLFQDGIKLLRCK